jgi:hypothetical protein
MKRSFFPTGLYSVIVITTIFVLLACSLCACANSKSDAVASPEITAESVSPETSIAAASEAPSVAAETPSPTVTVTAAPTPKKTVKAEKPVESDSTVIDSTAAKVPEGVFVGSDEFYNFYLNDGKIHSVRYSGTEVDNKTFAYNSFLYFDSEKGIYNLKPDGTELQLLVRNGEGHFGGTYMTITKVEKGTVYYISTGFIGTSKMRYRIPNDPTWSEPVSFGQFADVNDVYKFCFDDSGIIYVFHSYNQNITFCDINLSEAQISYGDDIYFEFASNIYRVTTKGSGFECYYTPEDKTDLNYLKIDKIDNGVIYYSETTNGGHTVTQKQLAIK